MKSEKIITYTGILLIILGLIAFYSIQVDYDSEQYLKSIKHGGTFVGLIGIGVTVAGILLYLINRGQHPTSPEVQDL